MLNHPRSDIVGLSLVVKLGLDPVYSFGDIAIFYILPFWLEIAYSSPLEGAVEWEHIPPNIVTHCSNLQKDHSCAETRRLSHKA